MTRDSAVSHPQNGSGGTDAAASVIVVGLDGSPTSWDAFAWAAGEAIRLRANLLAVYVTPAVETLTATGVPFDLALVEQARGEAADRLRCEAERAARELGVHLTFVRKRGDPSSSIIAAALAVGADLIVVGRSEKWLHHLTGSLGRRLVSRHNAPVVVVVP
jgi:nucleotide-binding universal stress UspA family protein